MSLVAKSMNRVRGKEWKQRDTETITFVQTIKRKNKRPKKLEERERV